MSSGVRISELCALKIEDIELDEFVVHVHNGKGGKDRITFMNAVTVTAINDMMSLRNDDNPYLFVTRLIKPIKPGSVRLILSELAQSSGVENVHPHKFRRTFATNLYNKGMDLRKIQLLMGHANINTTTIYLSNEYKALRDEYCNIA